MGNHLPHCPNRKGQSYTEYLATKKPKAMKQKCHKCGKMFKRLDTHLKNSASCKDTGDMISQYRHNKHSGLSDIARYPDPSPATIETAPSSNNQPKDTSPPTFKPALIYPTTNNEWKNADCSLKLTVVPDVLNERSLETKCSILVEGIYKYFSSFHGTLNTSKGKKRKATHTPHNRSLKHYRSQKNEVRRDFRSAKKQNFPQEKVKELARKYHQLVRQHSKAKRQQVASKVGNDTKRQRKACQDNPWKFAKRLFSEKDHTSITPTFSPELATEFFEKNYSSTPLSFTRPQWLPVPPSPSTPFNDDTISFEEVKSAVKRSRASSTPSPIDQISYRVFKRCPSLLQALMNIYNTCWSQGVTPKIWKTGTIRLLGKPQAADDASNPSNFRPIALTPCIGKIYTTILKNRWLDFMIGNGYLNTASQKAFIRDTPGCIEHHMKLLSAISDAKCSHKSLTVCWLDIANAFGSVHHDLIMFALRHYHAPPRLLNVIDSIYSDLSAIIQTQSWSTGEIPLEMGVFQGDPLSVVIFNTVMNTLIDTLSQHLNLGYSYSSINQHNLTNLLQYADDTCLIADGPASCQRLLDIVDRWLKWAHMKAKVPKCCCLALRSSSSQPFDPKLSLSGTPIPYIGNGSIKFLGIHITLYPNHTSSRDKIYDKLQSLLTKLDKSLLTRKQKLRLYGIGICPRINWDLTVCNVPVSWLEKHLQPLVTKYLKKWSGLAKCADTSRIYLPKADGGLGLPSVYSNYRKLQLSRASQLLMSKDATVRNLAKHEVDKESLGTRARFKPFNEAVECVSQLGKGKRKDVIRRAKGRVMEEDRQQRYEHATSLKHQGQLFNTVEDQAADLWANTIWSLSDAVFKFALNAAQDCLPHNQNLHLWKKKASSLCPLCHQNQSLLHVLNSCPIALQLRRFSLRHDNVLRDILTFIQQHLDESHQVTCDLPELKYTFPQQIATDLRPDIVVSHKAKKLIVLIELTIPFEMCFDDAASRKEAKYTELVKECISQGWITKLITIEVGSRGFLNQPGFKKLATFLKATKDDLDALKSSCIKTALAGSFKIWSQRNTCNN